MTWPALGAAPAGTRIMPSAPRSPGSGLGGIVLGGVRIHITGSAGLIGRAVGHALRRQGHEVVGIDPRAEDPTERGDLCDTDALAARLTGVAGILHLGAVSRVIAG